MAEVECLGVDKLEPDTKIGFLIRLLAYLNCNHTGSVLPALSPRLYPGTLKNAKYVADSHC